MGKLQRQLVMMLQTPQAPIRCSRKKQKRARRPASSTVVVWYLGRLSTRLYMPKLLQHAEHVVVRGAGNDLVVLVEPQYLAKRH